MGVATVRRLGAADLADYRQIRLSALQTAPDAFGSTFEAELAQTDEQRASRLATSVVLGAYAGAQIVGCVGCKRFDSAKEDHKAFLWGFFVEPDHRRSGVGNALLGAVLDAMRGTIEQVQLTVVADNRPAIACYERLGFTRYGLEARSLRTSIGYSDELLMVLFLSPGN